MAETTKTKKRAAKPRPIRLGILGLGRAGYGMHYKELVGKEKMFEIVAGCDIYEPWRERLKKKLPAARVYSRMEDLYADPNVDLLAVATRSCDHVDHTLAALKTGKHVLLEKPICLTYAEARRIARAAEKAKGKLFIRHNRRCEPGFCHIREIIKSGILGEVYEIKLTRASYQRRDDWQTLIKNGGGQLLNWGPHLIDHGLQLLGAPKRPLRGVWSDLRVVAAVGDAEDHLKVVLTGASGAIVDIEISGGAAIPRPEYVIWGSKGGLRGAGDEIKLRYLNPKKQLKPRKPIDGDPPKGFGPGEKLPWIEKTIKVNPKFAFDIWDELFKAIRLRKKYPIATAEAVEVMRVISLVKKGTPFAAKK